MKKLNPTLFQALAFSPADQQNAQDGGKGNPAPHPLSDQPVPSEPPRFPTTSPDPHLQAIRKLSTREREILLHLAQYKTMNQIAECLFISPITVNNHKARMNEKLNLKGRYQLLQFAQSVQHLL